MKSYFIIRIEKVVEDKPDKMSLLVDRQPYRHNQPVFIDDMTPEEAVEIMGFIIERRKGRTRT